MESCAKLGSKQTPALSVSSPCRLPSAISRFGCCMKSERPSLFVARCSPLCATNYRAHSSVELVTHWNSLSATRLYCFVIAHTHTQTNTLDQLAGLALPSFSAAPLWANTLLRRKLVQTIVMHAFCNQPTPQISALFLSRRPSSSQECPCLNSVPSTSWLAGCTTSTPAARR